MRRAVGCSIGTWLVLWACDFTAAMGSFAATKTSDIPISSNYVIKKQDSCPDVGYYFRREPSPNAVDPGPCLLCFCKDPGTAACWVRDPKKCDVDNYIFNISDSDITGRVRRSPLGLGDIFFRDATKDFFAKDLPKQCEPNKGSFSDGCPPADWCLGCTVCDCDSNGRWDCHILSFCNEEERKKKLKNSKIQVKNTPKPLTMKNGKRLHQSITNKTTKKPAKSTKKTTNNKLAKQTKKAVKHSKKAPKTTKSVNRTRSSKPKKKVIKRIVKKEKKDKKKYKGDSKTQKPKIIIKKRVSNKTIKQKKRENPKQIHSKKITKPEVIKSDLTQRTNKSKASKPSKKEYEMGKMLVKKVNQKMVKSELDMINKTAIEKGLTTTERNKKKKSKPKEFKNKNIGEEFRWMRNKRDISDEPTTSIYVNGIATTTDRDTGTSIGIDSVTALTNKKDVVITTSNKTLLPDIILNLNDNFDDKIRPLDKTKKYLLENNNISNSNTPFKFQIVVNDDLNTKDQSSEKNSNVKTADSKGQLLEKWPIMSSYKYNIDHESIDNSVQISTIVKTNTIEKDVNKEMNSIKTDTKDIKKEPRKFNVMKKINSKGYRKLSDIYFPSKDISAQRSFNKTRKEINKINFLKYIKKILNKLIYFGKRSNRLGKEDEYQIVKILCEDMKSCKITKRNRKILKNKIKKLNAETKTIFRTIKIIKGLLHLIDIPDLNNNVTNLKNDIKKLNTILKGKILDGRNLTATQKTQIAYLKTNTKTFIMAVSRFTSLVNEVTAILQKNNKQKVSRKTNFAKKNMTISFDNIKKVLLNHNLVENTFIKKIYTMLTDLEFKVSNKTKVSDKRINSYVINRYSRDIVDNLRKLRDLAQTLNSSRRKRQISGDDDTMQYLLLLLDYLLKQDSRATQLNRIQPVHDGIDVLIETIKNAPDIKDFRKKLLGDFSQLPIVQRTVNLKATDENKTATIESDQLSESNYVSKESNDTKLIDISMDPKIETLNSEDEIFKTLPDLKESENIMANYSIDLVQNKSENIHHDEGLDAKSNSHQDPAKDAKGYPYSDSAQEETDISYLDSVQDVKSSFYHNSAQDVSGNPHHDTAQDAKGNHYLDSAQGAKSNIYQDTTQDVRSNPRHDPQQDAKGNYYLGFAQDVKNKSYYYDSAQDVKGNPNRGFTQVAKNNIHKNTTQNVRSDPHHDPAQDAKGNPDLDSAQDLKGNFHHDPGQDERDNPHHDTVQNEKSNIYHDAAQDIKGNSYHDSAQDERGDPHHDTAQNAKGDIYHDLVQNLRSNLHLNPAQDAKGNHYLDSAQDVKGNFYHDSAQVRGNPDHDTMLDAKLNINNDITQDVRSNPHHDSAQDESGNPDHHTAQDAKSNSYHDTAQEIKGDPYHDSAQDVKFNSSHESAQDVRSNSYHDYVQDVRDSINNEQKLREQMSYEEETRRNFKVKGKENNDTQIFINNQNNVDLENIKGVGFVDASFKETENLFNEGVTPNTEGATQKDLIKSQNSGAYDEATPKFNLNEDATQIVRAIPFEDISQNVYYERIDANATNYDLYENNTFTSPQTITAKTEKLGFDKFENSIDIERKLGSDSEEDTYPVANFTSETQPEGINNRTHIMQYADSDQSSDNIGNLVWIEENFGKELTDLSQRIKDKVVSNRDILTTTARPMPSTMTIQPPTAPVKQAFDFSDVSDENDGHKKEKKLSAEEIVYRKQMDLLNSLDYGTEKSDIDDTKSEDDTPESIFV